MRIRGIVAALAVALTLATCTTGSAFTVAPLDGKLTTDIEQIVADVQSGVVSDGMLTRIENTIDQIDDLLDAGAVNELELLEARAQLIDARAQVVAANAKGSQHQLVQAPMGEMHADFGGQGSTGTPGSSFSGGGTTGGSFSSGGMSGGAGGLGGLAGLAVVGGVVGATTSNNKSNTILPGPVASNTLP